MAKDYLCKNCKNNNNGWCTQLKKQGLKEITTCEYYYDRNSTSIPSVTENDMMDTIITYQQPIKVVNIEERLPKEKTTYKRSENNDFEMHLKIMKARSIVEGHYEWDKWAREIPYIQFPGNWLVKAIPPYAGAIIRYIIKHTNPESESISIYLDCYGELGCVDEPYWELYPNVDGDIFRCGINDTNELLSQLHLILDRYN